MDIRILFMTVILVSVRAYLSHSEYPFILKGAQIISVICETEDDLIMLNDYNNNFDGFEFLRVGLSPINVQVFVLDDPADLFKTSLKSKGLKYKVLVSNFEKLANEVSHRGENTSTTSTYDFTYYPRYEEIQNYLIKIYETHDSVSLFNIGRSNEGREIFGLKFSSGESVDKPALLIDAGMDAREWIAPTTALYAISQLVKDANKNLYENVDWYIIPLVNPDGYEYSHTTDRLWKKTRSSRPGSNCRGVDLNTNFDYHWDYFLNTFDKPCYGNYPGSQAFSEVEIQHLRDFVLSRNKNIKLYLTLHSSGPCILYPWVYTVEPIERELELVYVAQRAEAALSAVRGTNYTIGNWGTLMYLITPGASMDWMMGSGGVDFAYTINLPGNSFCTPKNQIVPVGQETFEAFRMFSDIVADINKT